MKRVIDAEYTVIRDPRALRRRISKWWIVPVAGLLALVGLKVADAPREGSPPAAPASR